MNKQTTNLILLAAGAFIIYKVWMKPKTVSSATVQQAPGVAAGNNITNWTNTIAGLYGSISSIFSGNSTSNPSTPPAGQVAPITVQPPGTFGSDLGLGDIGIELPISSAGGG